MFDEIDRYEVTKEGHAIPLATKRTRTFHNRKILKVSSPSLENVGIHEEYESADIRHEFHLQCRDCGETQMPFLKHFQWEDDIKNAVYVCEHCGTTYSIKEQDRIKATGRWVVTHDNGEVRKKAFWMNQFASPFASWLETLEEFLAAKGDPQKLRVVVNTAFAEVWRDEGERVEYETLLQRRENYEVPDDILLVVAGVDTQDDRLELEYIGYGMGKESWGLGYHVLHGDPGKKQVWDDLDKALQKTFTTADGRTLQVAATGIDSGGHYTQEVYNFCKERKARRVWALKGVGGEGRAIVTAPSKKKGPNSRPVDLYTVGVDAAKAMLYASLRITEPGANFCHFPTGYDVEYFAQLTAEEMRTRYRKGFKVREWVKTRPRNEALDIRVYAYAALTILNPIWDVLKKLPVSTQKEERQPQKLAKRSSRRQNAGRSSGYVKSW
jgi:phage terminase large subunit GpA-like protein